MSLYRIVDSARKRQATGEVLKADIGKPVSMVVYDSFGRQEVRIPLVGTIRLQDDFYEFLFFDERRIPHKIDLGFRHNISYSDNGYRPLGEKGQYIRNGIGIGEIASYQVKSSTQRRHARADLEAVFPYNAPKNPFPDKLRYRLGEI